MSTTGLAARTHEEFAPVYGDKVIVLSTCLIGNHYNRFVVMGKLIYDSSEVNNSAVIDASTVASE
jgi:sortase B